MRRQFAASPLAEEHFCSADVLIGEGHSVAPTPSSAGHFGGGDTAAAMGILSRGFRAKLFLSLWSSLGS
jgi:hypothetical protein